MKTQNADGDELLYPLNLTASLNQGQQNDSEHATNA
jgi:hypothetical protein